MLYYRLIFVSFSIVRPQHLYLQGREIMFHPSSASGGHLKFFDPSLFFVSVLHIDVFRLFKISKAIAYNYPNPDLQCHSPFAQLCPVCGYFEISGYPNLFTILLILIFFGFSFFEGPCISISMSLASISWPFCSTMCNF